MEKEEPPELGSSIRPIERMPRTCRTGVNSPGTFFAASALHSSERGVVMEEASTDWT